MTPTSDTPSGDTSPEAVLEQVRQQAEEYKKKYETLQTQVTEGKLVDPASFVEAKIKAGELFPKERFVGLQQTYQATQQTLSELQGKVANYEKQVTTLEKDLTLKSTDADEKDVELETLRRSQVRAKLIFGKFPELAGFEADGLLPEAEEGELEKIFTAFSSKLGSVEKEAAAKFGAGGTPPTPPRVEKSVTQTAKTHLALANDALAKSDFTTYNLEYDKYLETLNTQP